MTENSNYPAPNIARDAAGQLVAEWLRANWALPDNARTVLTRRCTEVRRHDLANSLHGIGDTKPGQELVKAFQRAIPDLLEELDQHALHGPTPTQDAYDAACAALNRHRQRADEAEALLARIRQHVNDCDGLNMWPLRELLAGREATQ